MSTLATAGFDAEKARASAHDLAGHGVAFIAQAINACDNPAVPYRFTNATRRRLEALICEIVAMIDEGEIRPFAPGVARCDGEFQAFLRQAIPRARRARKGKQSSPAIGHGLMDDMEGSL